MTTLQGRLTGPGGGALDRFTVTATFDVRVAKGAAGVAAARRTAPVDTDGRFTLELPDADAIRSPLTVTAHGPDGLPAGEVVLPAETPPGPVEIEVVAAPPTPVRPSTDVTLGQQLRYTGRAIDPQGVGFPAGLLLVIWARSDEPGAAVPISVTRTSTGGYFSAPWPDGRYAEAFGVISGGTPIPIALEDGSLPRQLVLVSADEAPAAADDDCSCDSSPPAVPDAGDLAANPEAFAADPGHCVDLTVPDRTIDEVAYQAVVRTTQPALKAATPQEQPVIPGSLIDRIVDLAQTRPVIDGRPTYDPEIEPGGGQFPGTFELPGTEPDHSFETDPGSLPVRIRGRRRAAGRPGRRAQARARDRPRRSLGAERTCRQGAAGPGRASPRGRPTAPGSRRPRRDRPAAGAADPAAADQGRADERGAALPRSGGADRPLALRTLHPRHGPADRLGRAPGRLSGDHRPSRPPPHLQAGVGCGGVLARRSPLLPADGARAAEARVGARLEPHRGGQPQGRADRHRGAGGRSQPRQRRRRRDPRDVDARRCEAARMPTPAQSAPPWRGSSGR